MGKSESRDARFESASSFINGKYFIVIPPLITCGLLLVLILKLRFLLTIITTIGGAKEMGH